MHIHIYKHTYICVYIYIAAHAKDATAAALDAVRLQ